MPGIELPAPLKLDPWAASSLLQKAIRRGEVDLARRAGQTLHRHRGAAVFHRLCVIAVEDIGIADVALLQEVTRIATDKALRSILGTDAELIDLLCGRMAVAVKDRSADYLYSAAAYFRSSIRERAQFELLATDQLIEIAADLDTPLRRRAVAALLACAKHRSGKVLIRRDHVDALLEALPTTTEVDEAVRRLGSMQMHPFYLLLPLVWSSWAATCGKRKVVMDELPAAQFCKGIPLHTYDKHTAAGKQALASLARLNDAVRGLPYQSRAGATEISAFYADAAPVARRLDWPEGRQLQRDGFLADMADVGCDEVRADAVLASVRESLAQLNDLRRAALGSRRANLPRKL